MPLRLPTPWNVLVFPAASEIGLEIHQALSRSKEVVLHGANTVGASAADCHFARLHTLPSIYETECLGALKKLIVAEKIDAIFPAYDDVIVWLSNHRSELKTTLIVPPVHIANLCRTKSATYAAFENILATPRCWMATDADISFPVFVKPDMGQGSQRARKIDCSADLKQAFESEPDLIITEYLPGYEYTVDCFSQKGRGVLFAQARRRIHTKAGIATISETVDLPIAVQWAKLIDTFLQLQGAWFFQIKEDSEGQFKLLEIAPRIAGSMALSRVLGPNFPLLTLYEAAGLNVEVSSIPTSMAVFRSLDLRFRHNLKIDCLYIDLDDTLIIREKINVQLVALIFQFRNNGIPVKLITRHNADLDATLKKFRLSELFDDLIHIEDRTLTKAAFIEEAAAVLIDDSFTERRAASATGRIACFDSAAAICLIDDRA